MRSIALKDEQGALLCPVRLNSQSEVWLLFDTGATSTLLYRQAAERLRIRQKLQREEIFMLGKGSVVANVGIIERLELLGAGFSVSNLVVPIADEGLSQQETTAGVLGMDVISRLGIFCLRDKKVELLSHFSPNTRFTPIPARFRYDNLRIWVSIQLGKGKPIPYLWDTGSDLTLSSPNILPTQLVRRGGRREKRSRSKIIVTYDEVASRPFESTYYWRFPSVRLGAAELNPFPVFEYGGISAGWGKNYGLLGSPILTEFEVLHDFKLQRLYMRRYRQNLAGTYGLMLTLRETQRGLRWEAFANFPTEVSGRLPDDSAVELLAVNDVPVGQWETVPLIRHLLFPTARRRCKIRYQAKGKTREAILQAVGVPYIGMPPQLLAIVRIPRTEVAYGLTPEKRVLSLRLSRGLRGVRGSQRNLQVKYVDYAWRFD